jgi:glucokinase
LLNVRDMSAHRLVAQMFYKNNDFISFTNVMLSFMSLPQNVGRKVLAAVLATAGPVSNNCINFTNREGWIIDGRALQEEFSINHVLLVNDFVANGYGLLGLDTSEVVTLQPGLWTPTTHVAADGSAAQAGTHGAGMGAPVPVDAPGAADQHHPSPAVTGEIFSDAPKALVGAGTGLGECFLTPGSNGLYQAYASEGGHVEFAPRTDLEEELLKYLQEKLAANNGHAEAGERTRISVERVVSGKGLENIYEFLRQKFPHEVDPRMDEDFNESSERGRLIGAEKYNYSLFKRALEMMFAIYGCEVGNVALKYLPYGGLYVAGGIAPKNIEFINSPNSPFMRRFLDKGRMSSIMTHFPVHVVMKEDLGLRGAHIVAARIAGQALQAMHHEVPSAPKPLPIDGAAKLVEKERARLPSQDTLRNAINDYPVTYAVATSLTAALTATAIVLGTQVLSMRLRSR